MEPNAHKIEEHRRKYERQHKEREEKKIERERQQRRAEAQVLNFDMDMLKKKNLARHVM